MEFVLGIAVGIGVAIAGKALLDRRKPKPPKPHRHNWIFTNGPDGVLRTCVDCGESDVTLFKHMPGQNPPRVGKP